MFLQTTMGTFTLIKEKDNKLTTVNLNKLILYFSYETLIGFVTSLDIRKKLFMNEQFLNYSKNTSKHINFIKQSNNLEPIWKNQETFEEMLNIILFP